MANNKYNIDADETNDGVKISSVPKKWLESGNIPDWVTPVIDQTLLELIGEVDAAPTANTVLGRLKELETSLASVDGKDFATETKLEAVRVLLNSLDGKDYATETTLDTRLSNLESKLDTLLNSQDETDNTLQVSQKGSIDLTKEDDFLQKLETIAVNTNSATDINNPDTLSYGDMDAGFFGVIPASDFITGDALCSELGITQGTSQFSNTPWLKFAFKGDILITPMKPIRYGISWNSIYNAGAVYGDGTVGFNPPNGRIGTRLDIQASDNSINITPSNDDGFLRDGAEIGSAGDTIVLAGFGDNDGEHVIDSITDTKIIITSASTLVDYAGTRDSRVWNKADEVVQDASTTINGINYTVRLMKGAAEDPTDSFTDGDRGSLGADNEWNALMLPIHEKAKLGNWNYSSYVPADVPDWGIGFSDGDLITHRKFGNGSRRWMQETRDDYVVTRVYRGRSGVSILLGYLSWSAGSRRGFAPALVRG